MTQRILFLVMLAIGFGYSVKYGNRAKKKIEEYQNKKEDEAHSNNHDRSDL